MDIRSALSWSVAGFLLLTLAACQGPQAPATPSGSATTAPAVTGSPTSSASVSQSAGTTTTAPSTSGEPSVNLPFNMPETTYSPPGPWQPNSVSITAVRVGHHDGYDRAVIDLSGGQGIGWMTHWTDDPHTQGKGDPVDLPGTITLVVVVTGLETPPAVSGPMRDQNLAAGVIVGVYVDPVFEGQAQVMIALDKQRPYRIFSSDNPARLVVDIQNT